MRTALTSRLLRKRGGGVVEPSEPTDGYTVTLHLNPDDYLENGSDTLCGYKINQGEWQYLGGTTSTSIVLNNVKNVAFCYHERVGWPPRGSTYFEIGTSLNANDIASVPFGLESNEITVAANKDWYLTIRVELDEGGDIIIDEDIPLE